MKPLLLSVAGLAFLGLGCTPQPAENTQQPAAEQATETAAPNYAVDVPVTYYTLDNGLKVVISPDDTAPIAAVGVYYNIGFRIEPKDRTGFAHLFEHMMFQGSENLGKMELVKLIQNNGGVLNGSTRFDYTNYFEVVPKHTLETMLWAEADRMRSLKITQENLTNQQGVVKNEVKVNVLNQPYGGFPWLDMPQYAFDNWYNAHNFYGDLEDLDAANLDDVKAFFTQYYSPSNAVLVVVGDVSIDDTKGMIEKYFANIPSVEPKALPDVTELAQQKERVHNKYDKLAPKPAYAFAYRMPPRDTPEYYAMGIIDQILVQGNDSLLRKQLVNETGLTGDINGGINYLLGNMFNYNGPMLWMAHLTHETPEQREAITQSIDAVMTGLVENPITEAQIELAKTKLKSDLYDTYEGFFGVGKLDLLASFALFDDNPGKINQLDEAFAAVTPELIQQTAKQYLHPGNRTVLTVTPGEAPQATATEGEGE
ncbi:insulinase family protein [Aestuariibacter halophilus]|uniref:Insulinase family protein n=1 Tax=Fluctibacter halophilus TaxID=226011 RepID=A0ABS8GCV4_9ALTE|nr:pitrilysin family protein [Aestuariibacter halophilus]MCC2618343.1 insulinase family protein [Aestuariibacter halophilus]